MLDTPEHGWSHITIGDWSDRCSYLDNVPEKLCDALKEAIRGDFGIAHFDAEGYEYTLIFHTAFHCVHIITNDGDGEWKYRTIECNVRELAFELAEDLINHIDDWIAWLNRGHEVDTEEKCKRCIDMTRDCLRLVEIAKRR